MRCTGGPGGSGGLERSLLAAVMKLRASAALQELLLCASCSSLWPSMAGGVVMPPNMQDLLRKATRPAGLTQRLICSGKQAATAVLLLPVTCVWQDLPMVRIPALQP